MTTHYTFKQLIEYTQAPDEPEFQALRQHLIGCADCRAKTDQLMSMTQQITQVAHLTDKNLDTETIAACIDSQNEKENNKGAAPFKDNPLFLKAALHYAAHSHAMRRDADSGATPAQNTGGRDSDAAAKSTLAGLFARWLDWHPPAWIAVPVTATIVFTLSFYLLPGNEHEFQGIKLAAYQDKPVITFQDTKTKRPGIGFFDTTKVESKPFGPVAVNMDSNNILTIEWPALDNINEYTITLTQVTGDETKVIAQQSASTPMTVFENFYPLAGQRYEWRISGTTLDNNDYFATGGFVTF